MIYASVTRFYVIFTRFYAIFAIFTLFLPGKKFSIPGTKNFYLGLVPRLNEFDTNTWYRS